jgi:cell division protein FtsW
MYIHKKTPIISPVSLYIAIIFLLIVIGTVFIYSASSVYALEKLGSGHYFAKKHMFGIILGIVSLFITMHVPLQFIKKIIPTVFIATLCMTIMTLIPLFSRTIHGSSRWLNLGIVIFQPSELLKYAFVVYLAHFFAKKNKRTTELSVYVPFLCILGITGFTLLLQPDFGMTVTLCLTGIMLAFIAGVQTKHLIRTSLALLPVALLLIYLKPYRIKRVLTFLNPWADPQGSGFQIIQSFIAIGSGNIWGVGIGQSKQKFFYLPMQHTDFIFSIIAEETGFIGATVVILLFTFFLYTGLRLAFLQDDLFGRYVICGFVILLSLQALINIAVATGLVPTKGIGLPFISYGNSSLVTTLAMIGLILNITKQN